MRETIKQDAALMQATMQELAVGYRGLVRALTDMKLRQSAERLGNYLLQQSAILDDPPAFELNGEKRVLASLLGMTPENLSRAFGALRDHGLSINGAQISITDRERLVQFSRPDSIRSEEHTSELQSLMRTSYADFCWQKILTTMLTIVFRYDLHFLSFIATRWKLLTSLL